MPLGKLRHVGWKVQNLEQEIRNWQGMGYEPLEVESFRTCKMTNKFGMTIELIEGDYDPHVSVNWYRDENDNLFELVEEVKCTL